jgi:hypothetical protein
MPARATPPCALQPRLLAPTTPTSCTLCGHAAAHGPTRPAAPLLHQTIHPSLVHLFLLCSSVLSSSSTPWPLSACLDATALRALRVVPPPRAALASLASECPPHPLWPSPSPRPCRPASRSVDTGQAWPRKAAVEAPVAPLPPTRQCSPRRGLEPHRAPSPASPSATARVPVGRRGELSHPSPSPPGVARGAIVRVTCVARLWRGERDQHPAAACA